MMPPRKMRRKMIAPEKMSREAKRSGGGTLFSLDCNDANASARRALAKRAFVHRECDAGPRPLDGGLGPPKKEGGPYGIYRCSSGFPAI